MKQHIFIKGFVAFAVLILINISCNKDRSYMNDAEIIGWDPTMCAFCGGLEITIDNIPNPIGNTYYLVNQMPSNFHVDMNSKFPIAVKIDWKIASPPYFTNRIDIIRIARL